MTKFEKTLLQKVRAKGFIYHQGVLDYIDSLTIRERALEFAEKYFEDMRLEEKSIIGDFVWTDECGDALATELRIFLENVVFDYRYVVGTLKDYDGETDSVKQTVTIARGHENDDAILLHELIHVYEGLYKAHTILSPVRDALLIRLYNDLKRKLSVGDRRYPNARLDALILKRQHALSSQQTMRQGGEHNLLFYLKSLDLDIRLKYPLGTVFGYKDEPEPTKKNKRQQNKTKTAKR